MAIFQAARQVADWRSALACAIGASLLLRAPQEMAHWGGNPTVLGLAFIPMLLTGENLMTKRPALGATMCTACLIGLFQTHTIVFMQTAYICIPAFVIVRTLSPRPPAVYWKAVAAICLLFFALQLPYIINIDLSGIDSQVTSWIENWVRNTSHAWRGNLGNSFWSIPVYLYHRLNLDNMFLPLLLLTGLIGGISLWNKQREACLTYTLFFPFVFLLVLNCQYWVLPASYLIYPERTAAMLAIPIAVLAAAGLDLLLSKSRKDAANYIRLSILLVALGIGNFYSQQYYVNGIRGESTVTQSDMTALKWMASNIPHEALIANNYGDAGIWIPAMTGHSVVGPMSISPYNSKQKTHSSGLCLHRSKAGLRQAILHRGKIAETKRLYFAFQKREHLYFQENQMSQTFTTPFVFSVVVPCYNEEATLVQSVERLLGIADEHLSLEVLIVDDCSTDKSLQLAQELADRHNEIRILQHERNQGKGAALRTGFQHATGDYVGIHDADLEYNPQDLHNLLEPLLEGKADAVFGSRYLSGKARRVLYFYHTMVNKCLTFISNMFTDLMLTDMETCYKLFRRELIQSIDLREDRFGIEPEMVSKVAQTGARIYEIGISYEGRTYDEGKKIGWKDGIRALYCLMRYNAYCAPCRSNSLYTSSSVVAQPCSTQHASSFSCSPCHQPCRVHRLYRSCVSQLRTMHTPSFPLPGALERRF